MKVSSFLTFSFYGVREILFHTNRPILGTIILTDKCNLHCKHCAVNNIKGIVYPFEQIKREMNLLYDQGIRILFFCGGETFLWEDQGKTVRDLTIEARKIGFLIINIVTNGTFPIDVPEADLILLSLDGDREHHNEIRGEVFDQIMENVEHATKDNIIFYMAVNQLNKNVIDKVGDITMQMKNVRAVSFNFHTPYIGTEALALSETEKEMCCQEICKLMERGVPVFNLKSVFPYLIHNDFPTPCRQCMVMENGQIWTCGRCVDEPGLCEKCGYFFAAEYALVFKGNVKVIFDMIRTYLRYI